MRRYSIRIQLLPGSFWGRLLVALIAALVLGIAFFVLTFALAVAGLLLGAAVLRVLWTQRAIGRREPRVIEGESSVRPPEPESRQELPSLKQTQ